MQYNKLPTHWHEPAKQNQGPFYKSGLSYLTKILKSSKPKIVNIPSKPKQKYSHCHFAANNNRFPVIYNTWKNLKSPFVTLSLIISILTLFWYLGQTLPKLTHPHTSPTTSYSTAQLETLVNELRSMDKDAPTTTDITLDWGKKITPSHGGKGTGKPFISHVNETLFSTPIYQALINIYGGNVFKPEVCQPESLIETSKKVLIDQFFDLYTKSEMFQKVYLFLTQNKIVKEDGFYERLFTWWFGTYTRCHGPVGSSGFEHVFSGEHKNEIVDGHHSWVRYYLGQKAGLIEYHGYESRVANLTGTIQYKWQGHLKLIGGFLMQTSPLFDFSLYTLCSMLQIENGGCHFKIDEHPLSVTSFHEKCLDGVCLTTAYPSE